MAFSILKNLRSLIESSNRSTKTLNKAATEVERLTAEAKAAEKAGDMLRAANLLGKAEKIAKNAEDAIKFLKGNGEVGAKTIQEAPLKFKEMGSFLKKLREQFIHNVEKSKIHDKGVIKSTPKNINPFGNSGGGSMSI